MSPTEITEKTRVAMNAAQIIIAVSAIFLGGFTANKWTSSVERGAADGTLALEKVTELAQQMAGLASAIDALARELGQRP